jgi:succinate-acetate transporter protein
LFGGILQVICGLLNFGIQGGTFTATVLSSFGAFWAGQGLLMIPNLAAITGLYTPEMLSKAFGVYSLAWSITAYWFMAIATRLQKGTWLLVGALFFVGTTLLLLCISSFSGCQRAGGVTGMMAAMLAWWKATADLLVEEGEIIPNWPMGSYSSKGSRCCGMSIYSLGGYSYKDISIAIFTP